MWEIFVANNLSRLSTYKCKQKLIKMAGLQVLLPQPRTRLCYQQDLKYRWWCTSYYGSVIAALLQ